MNAMKLILTLLFGFGTTVSCPAEDPAGIVLYLTTDHEVYLFLADHTVDTDRGWAGFGGGGEDGETPAETAARETEEETRGFFDQDDLLKGIKGSEPVFDGTFYLFFLEIGFVPALRIQNNLPASDEVTYRERGPYAWIPYSEVARYIETEDPVQKGSIDWKFLPEGTHSDWFWNVWLQNMRNAHSVGALPWCPPEDDG
jgi:8-oxo-dGTP pyrophosphatase MutT (NUDIX family)